MHKSLGIDKFLVSNFRQEYKIPAVDRRFRASHIGMHGTFQETAISKILTLTAWNAVESANLLKTLDTINDDGRKSAE
jgi:hypothetical protein